MALSYCPSWEAFQQLDTEMAAFQHAQSDIATELLCFCDDCGVCVQDTLVDPFFEPEDFSYLDNNTHLLPYLNAPEPITSFPNDLYPVDEWECYQYPKRARNCGEFYAPDFIYGYSDGSNAAATCPAPEFLPEFSFSPVEAQLPMTGFSPGNSESSKKSNGGCLSAQSMAARQRRKRISEKTQELGRLIPGGNKMNTAEMLQAGFQYVKYLQAQVGILELMGSLQQEAKEGAQLAHVEELRVLASPKIQEKLYIEEKCVVPRELVEALAKDPELRSNSSISKDLDLLIKTLG
ncbi:transcription factor bHLH52 [Cinnamomum micranthum f. kanehirae]|uniref:Transcription factor bHLH52 n=1 Tax=Cinnamomum micranthum f. kanehirae TaxID=337451 RepID=A0A3S3N5I3_9MAGN|nr:transcription factor bHLH52 [Cinnamomum micranthum f. kanehirae]